MKFEWDDAKDEHNQKKHGISFSEAQRAFLDRRRIIAEDLEHSNEKEQRYFCFGEVDGGVITVRFTIRKNSIRIIGEKERRYMSKKTKKVKYTDEPINAKVIKDFLPKPEDLVLKEDNVKVTLSLSKKSVDFFKHEAKKLNTPYQGMIRSLLDQYTENFG